MTGLHTTHQNRYKTQSRFKKCNIKINCFSAYLVFLKNKKDEMTKKVGTAKLSIGEITYS